MPKLCSSILDGARKVMVTNGTICSTKLQNTVLKQVDTFPYLGSLITSDTVCRKEPKDSMSSPHSETYGKLMIFKLQ